MNLTDSKADFNFQFKYLPLHIIGLCGVILHVLLLIAFIKDPLKCFRNSATYLVANLAVSDLMMSSCGPYLTWVLHSRSLRSIIDISFGVSVITIISIAADRWLMVTYPFKHRYLMNGKKIIIWITFNWILSLVRGVQQDTAFAGANVYKFSIDTYLGVAIILVTGFLYVLTSISLRKQTRNLALHDASGSNRSQAARLLKEKQFVRTILLVACIAVVGIVPYTVAEHVRTMKKMRHDETLALEILWCFLITFFCFTFASNPLIYFLRLPRYRKTFYLLYWRRASN